MAILKLYSKIKSLKFYDTIKHGSFYSLSFIVIQLISILTLPVYTKLLQPSDFGIYEVFNHIVRLSTILFSLNMVGGLYRFYFDESVDNDKLLTYVLRISFYSFLIGILILFVFRNSLFSNLNIPTCLFVWVVIGIFTNIYINIFITYNTISQDSKRLAIWQVVFHIAKVITALVFMLWYSRTYFGRVIGETGVSFLLVIVILISYFRKYISLKIKIENYRAIVTYAVSFIPISLSGYFLGFVDTIMINSMIGNNDAGLYSYAYKIAIIYSGITTSFITANRPKLFDLYNQNKSIEIKEQFKSMFKLIVACSTLFILFSETGGKILALNPSFHSSLYLLPVLILSYIFSDLNELFSFFYYYEKKVKYFYYNFAISAILNILLNMYLLPRYGYKAAAYTTLISYAFMSAITYTTCKLILKAKIPAIINFLDYALIIIAVFAGNYYINHTDLNIWLILFIKGIAYVLIIIYLWKNLIKKFLFE